MPDTSPEILAPVDFYRPGELYLPPPRPNHRYWLHALLLLATIFSTMIVGARMQSNFLQGRPAFYATDSDDSLFFFPIGWAMRGGHLLLGVPFSVTLMAILFAHEMGHYLYCVRYGISATLPFFVPFPSLIGTLGAFIRIRSPIRSRSQLFDIGIAGPIAGFAVALPVMIFALPLSKALPPGMAQFDLPMGFPLIFRLAHYFLSEANASNSLNNLPLDHLMLHPIAIAAWVGMFATSLNLLPGGQLDGGHIVFAISPRRHKWVSRVAILVLIPMGLYLWSGWLIWAVLLRLSGMRHPMVPEWPEVELGRRRLAVVAALMLLLTLTPTPFADHSLLALLQQWRHS